MTIYIKKYMLIKTDIKIYVANFFFLWDRGYNLYFKFKSEIYHIRILVIDVYYNNDS